MSPTAALLATLLVGSTALADPTQPAPAPEEIERILDLHDVPESERDSQAAEDLVEEELTLAQRRALRAEASALRVGAHAAPRGWLPRLVLGASRARVGDRRDLRVFALAEVPLGPSPPPIRERPPPPPVPTTPPVPPAGLRCLAEARAAAVTRALTEPERARSMVARARRAAWLPELRLRVDRRLGRAESLDHGRTTTAVDPVLGLDTDDDVRYEARATWDLAKLVFSTEELAAQAQALRMAEMRRELEIAVTRAFFERARLVAEDVEEDMDARLRRRLRVQELDVELDVLSGGAFTACGAREQQHR